MDAVPDWKANHPFFVGQLIYAIHDLSANGGRQTIAKGSAVSVYIRGCDDGGNWVCLKGYPGSYYSTSAFCGAPSPAMLPVVVVDAELEA